MKEIKEALYGGVISTSTPVRVAEAKIEKPDVQPLADIAARDKAYRALLSICVLSKKHKEDLLKRGFSLDEIEENGYKSVPQSGLTQIAAALTKKGISLEGVPGFYLDTKNGVYKMLSHNSGYFISYYDEEGRIQGLQIRHDVAIKSDMSEKEVKEAKQKRYRWFTSSWVNKSNKGRIGTGSLNWAYYGRPGTLKPQSDKDFSVYVTEGGLKANAASVLLKRVYGKDRPFVAIPGVSCYSTFEQLCKTLKKKGVTIMVDAFDSDRNTNESVSNSIKRLSDIAEKNGIQFVPWRWDDKYKGCDDFLLAKYNYSRKKIRN